MILLVGHRWWRVVAMGLLMGCLLSGASDAAEPSPAIPTTLGAKFERQLRCSEDAKAALVQEYQTVQEHLRKIEAFRARLTDVTRDGPAINKADQALATDRVALQKLEKKIQLATRLSETLRKLEEQIQLATRLSDLRPVPGGVIAQRDVNPESDLATLSRLVDKNFGDRFGFVTDPVLLQRLTGLLTRLQQVSPPAQEPVQVRVLAAESGYGAFATATTIYFDKTYLDQNPSESELLFIASHELTHVQLSHFSQTLKKIEAETQHLAQELGPEGANALGWRTEQALLKMRTARWEQQQEEAADILGAEQALQAGALPTGLFEAFRRMYEAESHGASSSRPDVERFRESLRDHAKPMDRLKKLEDVLGEKFWERKDLSLSSPCQRK